MKNLSIKSCIFYLLCSLVFMACKKDAKETTTPESNHPIILQENERLNKVIPTKLISTIVTGKVLNELGKAIAGAEVIIGDQKTVTDGNGLFTFLSISTNENYSVVKVNKEGFFTGIRTFAPTQNRINKIELILLSKGASQSFKSSEGVTLNFESNKVQLEFPADAISTLDGKAYNGTVKVSARYLDPTAAGFSTYMPGNLTGLNNENQLNGLISYGMVSVELNDESGNKLEITNGKEVKVILPAITNAPTELPTWHFNEKYGIWVEAGKALKSNGKFEFYADYFSTWNLDANFDGITEVEVSVNSQNGNSISNQKIEIYSQNYINKLGTVFTDDAGKFRLLNAPSQMALKIVGGCGAAINKTLSVNSDKAVITILNSELTNVKLYTFTGSLKDCDNIKYANKIFILNSLGGDDFNLCGISDNNGNYSSTQLICSSLLTKTVDFEMNVNHQGNSIKKDTIKVTFSGSSQNLDLDFCNSNTEQGIFNIDDIKVLTPYSVKILYSLDLTNVQSIDDFGLVFSTKSDFSEVSKEILLEDTTAAIDSIITANLNPNTTYYVKTKISKNSLIIYGEVLSFKTPATFNSSLFGTYIGKLKAIDSLNRELIRGIDPLFPGYYNDTVTISQGSPMNIIIFKSKYFGNTAINVNSSTMISNFSNTSVGKVFIARSGNVNYYYDSCEILNTSRFYYTNLNSFFVRISANFKSSTLLPPNTSLVTRFEATYIKQ